MKILFWNCGGTGNLGDDLCHAGAVEYCRMLFGHVTAKRIFKLNDQTAADLESFDYLAIGGGQILDGSDFLERLKPHSKRIKYFFLGVGIGSHDNLAPHLDWLDPVFWNVRDFHSEEILSNCERGYRLEGICQDLSLLLKLPVKRTAPKYRIGLNFKNVDKTQRFAIEIADMLDQLSEPVCFFPFNSTDPGEKIIDGELCRYSDGNGEVLAREIKKLMKRQENLDIISYNDAHCDDPNQWLDNLRAAEFIICERYHAAVSAYRLGIPFNALPYHQKITRFLSDNDLENLQIDNGTAGIRNAIMRKVGSMC